VALDPVQVDERATGLAGRTEQAVLKGRTVPGGERSNRLL
jgi:hypothetical protein